MPFDLNKEKLRCLIYLDDSLAGRLSCTAGSMYWCAFILENRTTHQVSAQFRFKYVGGEKNWFQIHPKEQTNPEAVIADLRCNLEGVIKIALQVFGVETEAIENAIRCYYPPDDEGDPSRTLLWLDQQDLVEIEVEKTPPDGTDV